MCKWNPDSQDPDPDRRCTHGHKDHEELYNPHAKYLPPKIWCNQCWTVCAVSSNKRVRTGPIAFISDTFNSLKHPSQPRKPTDSAVNAPPRYQSQFMGAGPDPARQTSGQFASANNNVPSVYHGADMVANNTVLSPQVPGTMHSPYMVPNSTMLPSQAAAPVYGPSVVPNGTMLSPQAPGSLQSPVQGSSMSTQDRYTEWSNNGPAPQVAYGEYPAAHGAWEPSGNPYAGATNGIPGQQTGYGSVHPAQGFPEAAPSHFTVPPTGSLAATSPTSNPAPIYDASMGAANQSVDSLSSQVSSPPRFGGPYSVRRDKKSPEHEAPDLSRTSRDSRSMASHLP